MMRFSAENGDPGYAAYLKAKADGITIIVVLSGERMHGVITADEAEGVVVRAAMDESGYLVRDPEHPDQIKRETLHGTVGFILRHPAKWIG